MFKHSPSRHQRPKAFRPKHVLQICVLVAVCIWLLYQVKHSHGKKRELDESNPISEITSTNNHMNYRFGRKDLPDVHDDNDAENNSEDRESEDTEEGKHDEKKEDGEEEGRGVEDDLDEDDKERGEEEQQNEERGNDDDENEEKLDEKSLLGSSDNDDDDEKSTREAREEQYKGDDASSAVVRESEEENNDLGDENEEHKHDAEVTGDEIRGGDDSHDANDPGDDTQKVDDSSAVQKEDDSLLSNSTISSDTRHADAEVTNAEVRGEDDSRKADNPGDEAQKVDDSIIVRKEEDTYPSKSTSVDGTHLTENLDQADGYLSNSTALELSENSEQLSNSTSEAASNHTAHEYERNSPDNSTSETVPTTTLELPQEDSTTVIEMVTHDTSSENGTTNEIVDGDQNSRNSTETVVDNKLPELVDDVNAIPGNVTVEVIEKTDNTTGITGEEEETSHDSSSTGEDGETAGNDSIESAKADTITEEEKDARTDLSTLAEVQVEGTRSIEEIAAD